MILETLVTTLNTQGQAHLAPMGIHSEDGRIAVLPFRPSQTLENLLSTRQLSINYVDDVRIFAGCLTGRRDWPLSPTRQIHGVYLQQALGHLECEVESIDDDPVRPTIHCRVVQEYTHRPFGGFNRAQFSVLEAAILLSRIERLSAEKIQAELAYLRIGLEKTAGPREFEAWSWLMAAFNPADQETMHA
jgi:uncharacterized protein